MGLGKSATFALALLVAPGVVSSANAATLDFTVFPNGGQGTNVLVLPEATITGNGIEIFLGGGGVASEICARTGLGCTGDLQIDFTETVSNLSFEVLGYNGLSIPPFAFPDTAAAFAYDADNKLLDAINITANGNISFGMLSGISSLVLDDLGSSTHGGVAYDGFQFDVGSSSSVVPLPAALPLFAGGLGLLGLLGWRRKRMASA